MVHSILISVVVFGHSVMWWQWVGILSVFGGLTLSVRAKYAAKKGSVETRADTKGAVNGSGAASSGVAGGDSRKKER
ncbi:hypothetical protein Esi_0244_0018 [Ectocarpus siliculosus]|uniref:Uncharacterized protein n=1 Tax=Ectocarpus siliculosus TaxID=2880 RepID=D7FT28_ECTSI|nr:hypothetical protein Esi_0244_0018 [Ectocarpus siliculosus]|eukprot:CBJ31319.1 hypothetical protein Esi_0244_0018 [Ectocarpus siliculosus]